MWEGTATTTGNGTTEVEPLGPVTVTGTMTYHVVEVRSTLGE